MQVICAEKPIKFQESRIFYTTAARYVANMLPNECEQYFVCKRLFVGLFVNEYIPNLRNLNSS